MTDDATATETDPGAPRRADPDVASLVIPRWAAALAGLASGAVAVTTGMIVATFADRPSPIDAVGGSFIDRTPRWLKELAIDWFGTNDKTALRAGIVIVLAATSIGLGVVSRHRVRPMLVGIAVFAIVGALATGERPGSNALSVIAPFVGALVGSWATLLLFGRVRTMWFDAHRPRESRVPLGWDRRRFIGTTAAVGASSVVLGAVARRGESDRLRRVEEQRQSSLPDVDPANADTVAADIDFSGLDNGETTYITPNDDFYRIDTALSFPTVDLDAWRLRIGGMVDNEIELSYDDIAALTQIERTITICCVSNEVGGPYVGNATWQGVLLRDLLDLVGVREGAEQLFSRSIDGWTCGFPIDLARDGRDAMLAIGMNGEPLPLVHGFPARLIVPGVYGYVSATKWIESIEINRWSDAEGYWVPRGWAREAPIKTQSRIDVPRRGEKLIPGATKIAGVAWAQHTGIAKVEVRVDEDEWIEATLSEDLTDDAWRLWSVDWNASGGRHRIQVRATDKSGYTQTEEVASVAPDGATGWHTRTVDVI
ncbi:MAG: molybdopterin-dependent oxidoreductase [Actinobacteria bacterium]|nr:molybdopterin-dependent oxidoreductase [Actinomycetota bacterium]